MEPLPPQKPRRLYRFDNHSRAFLLLRDALDIMRHRPLTRLEQEGLIRRFGYTWELAWKMLKDYLETQGVMPPTITPASVIKAALAARLIDRGDVWMRALDARNRMSHTYDLEALERAVTAIRTEYAGLLDHLHRTMRGQQEHGASA